MTRRVHNPETVARPVAGYSQAVSYRVTGAEFIHLAGQVALDADNALIGIGDVEAQTRRTLENVSLILDDLGASLKDIVKMTVYAVDASHHPLITRVRNEFFVAEPPASTFVAVAALARPDWLVEIDVVAIRSV